MTNNGEKKKKMMPEEVTALLKTGARKRRPSKWAIAFYLLLLFAIPIGLLVWWFWPTSASPDLLIVVMDQISPPGAEIKVQAHLEPQSGEDRNARLEGWPVVLQEKRLSAQPGVPAWQDKVQSDKAGAASALWKLPGDSKTAMLIAHYAPPDREKGMPFDHGWVYCFPAATKLLIVDVERTLTEAELPAWEKKNVLDIRGKADAFKAIAGAVQESKREPVYLACAVASAGQYRKVRGWVQAERLSDGTGLPAGPVLGRGSYQADVTEKSESLQHLKVLKDRFTGPHLAVTSDPATAELFRGAGVQAILVGPGGIEQPGLKVLGNWSELGKQVPAK